MSLRVGIGYDVHRLVENRLLIIGGERIPFEKGLLGHSDADVLLHAIMDAILGAAGEGDIGMHFPDNDIRYKNADSMVLLKTVAEIIESKGYKTENIDAIVVAQEPKLSEYFNLMIRNISNVLGISPQQVNIKATTTEKLGFVGEGNGIEAKAIVLLDKKN